MIRTILGTTMLLGVIGCGGGGLGDTPDIGTVEGKVTLDGEPLADATVSFMPKEGRSSMAMTDKEGHYELDYTGAKKGAKVGQHKVSITTFKAAEDPDNPASAVAEKVPAKYNEQTTLSEEVKAGSNTIDFVLKSD